jgi:hypothetical protein
MLIVVVLVTTIMSQRTSKLFAKLTSTVTFIVSQRAPVLKFPFELVEPCAVRKLECP